VDVDVDVDDEHRIVIGPLAQEELEELNARLAYAQKHGITLEEATRRLEQREARESTARRRRRRPRRAHEIASARKRARGREALTPREARAPFP